MRRAAVILLGLVILAGCGPERSDAVRAGAIVLAPLDRLPDEMRRAPVTVREAYQFALANAELLHRLPCHCGCGSMGHTSNAACYLSPDSRPEAPVFDSHALGCTLCVDITQDVMRLPGQGTTLAESQRHVADPYPRYGPSNPR
jgi:hypothetical protein